MPARSDAQRKYLYAAKGAAWVKAHHFDTKGDLPAYASGPKRRRKKVKRPKHD